MARMKGLHHVGIPVRDIERSLQWYREVLGLEPEFEARAEGPDVDRNVQLENARLRFAFLPLGETILELLEYESPVGEDFRLRNCDVGAVHVCFEVEDIDAVYRELTARGVEFSIEPTRQSGPIEGQRCCYFRDPDGIQLELWQRA
jgi:catechol 2,3-dioxygenase-like lactoylglutathione lyase family enzyme